MSQELTDADKLREAADTIDRWIDYGHVHDDAIPKMLRSIADRLERPGVEEKTIRTLDHVLDWALIWNKQAGGYMASDVLTLIDRAERTIRASRLDKTMLGYREPVAADFERKLKEAGNEPNDSVTPQCDPSADPAKA